MKAEMVKVVEFTVLDNPVSPGGKSGFAIYRGSEKKGNREFTGKVAVVDRNSKAVALWRESVFDAARPDHTPLIYPQLTDDLVIKLMFTLPYTFKADQKRVYPGRKPDVDNLVKPTLDAITDAALWKDDSLIISAMISKAFMGSYHPDGTAALISGPGCVITVFKILPQTP